MNKPDLVAAAATAAGVDKKIVEKVLDATLATITGALAAQEEVKLVGFGIFSARNRPARTGRNPATGAPIKIAASVAPAFVASALLKTAIASKAAPKKVKR
ncbi:MAG: HU family DNA-binding protein [Burkholderiales bacterium]|nr:HU family DNA-binding protein [Burkholderiales bacterium]